MIDRRYVNYNKNELDRMAKWTVFNEIMYVSFYILKREIKYEPALYPQLPTYEPAMTYDEWIKKVRPSLTNRINLYSNNEIKFNLLAVVPDKLDNAKKEKDYE